MLRVVGQPSSNFAAIIGEVTTRRLPFYERHDKVLFTDKIDMGCVGYLAILTAASAENKFILPHMIGGISSNDSPLFKHGDIVSVSGTGEVLVLWEKDSDQNSLMLTEACNCCCVICPQPPKKHDPALVKAAHRILDLLKTRPVANICMTGGEPTIVADDFLNLLHRCHVEHPAAQINILTNAKLPVEIRHVVTRQNYRRLPEFAEHMYRYFPFCAHYALMSMEVCGTANVNVDSVYIDPVEYKLEMRKAALALHKRGLHVSVYNTPLCLCHEDIRAFSRQSISSWKNNFVEECSTCRGRDECCGFFSTSSVRSNHISPIM